MSDLAGKMLKYDVTTNYGLVLAPAQTVLMEEHLNLFRHHRIDFMDIITTNLQEQELEDVHSQDSSGLLVQKATQFAKQLFEQMEVQKKIPLFEIKNQLIPIVQQAAEHSDLFEIFEAVKAKNEYTHQHNVGVGILSTLIGKWLQLDEQEVGMLTLAATLHDVGKIEVSKDILQKPGKLTKEEFNEMKQHTVRGYNLLRETKGINYRVSLVALQHHERADGSGYPMGLRDSQIDRLSRIVAVADIFHAMTSKRPYQDMMPFHEVVRQMRAGLFGELDPHIVSVFLTNIIRGLIGRKVKLTDGRWAEVVYINPTDDTNPLVKIDEAFVDLSRERHIHIKEVVV
ncbi:HD-GYP domain-containing protein [Paenibacillus aceris]|uniref:HD-GYP domain-containing protein (C-di-GMP phosphodiesterase class II) n=1 Tax=Paenibacillus aceris TaxID=869555 RepID=A0ABS4I7Y2_9BACL|nr:HD-GYP domain-containing protein [Paenibacillus aceris]MBP1967034.1 HD-GYP domain-containing protein (c-di-GMP phosphodiesterase class II) [Paenibacillus aceris]NHW33231.1 HD-GYP domain-containing protein [Paenibacillus aceris]